MARLTWISDPRRWVLVLITAALISLVPHQAEAEGPPTDFAMIGDSITWQATSHIEALVAGIRVHAEIGWNFNRAIPELEKILAGGRPDVLIVALGTNPPLTLDRIDAFMDVAEGIPHVIFVNIRIPAEWEQPTNELIASLPGIYDTVSVLDWNSHSNARPWVFNTSGFHLSEEGKPEFASFVIGGAYAVVGACGAPTQTAPGSAGVGVVDSGRGYWWLRDPLTGDTTAFYYGNPGDVPFMGDWDGDGVDTPGLYRQSDGYVYLRNSNTQGIADITFFFGNPGDVPVPGDFDGDGFDSVSLYRPGEQRFYVINELGDGDAGLGAADEDFPFGNPGDTPIAGDFDGDGVDTAGIYRDGLVAITEDPRTEFAFGDPGDMPIVGSWEGAGIDSIGIFRTRTATFGLRSDNTTGPADHVFSYGRPRHLPIAGVFGDLPGVDDPPVIVPCPSP